MSYLVFARKYRPQKFDEIIGQEHITKSLKSAISSGRLAHAYIFSGPRGVGKTSCARILAKSLNCKNAPTVDPCGSCPACSEITKGNSLDVIEIDGASNRGIDDIRSLRENVKFASTGGKYKIYIIDEVHQITTDGFNALLKTLEEPPEHVKFIFATTALHKILPTIRSRCQRFEFRPIPALVILPKIEEIVKKEKIRIKKDALFAIAKAADGSLRDAESILDQMSSFSNSEITLADVVAVLGSVEDELIFSLIDRIIAKDPSGALDIVDKFINQGKDALVFVVSLIEYFRDLMVAKTVSGGLDKLLDIPSQMQDQVLEQSKKVTLAQILTSINILIDTQDMFKRVDSARIVLEMGVIKLIANFINSSKQAGSTQNSQGPLENDKSVKKATSVKTHVTKTPAPGAQKANVHHIKSQKLSRDKDVKKEDKKSVAMERIMDIWQTTIDKISEARMSIATYLNEGNPLRVEDNVLFIGFPVKYKFHKDVLEKKENSNFIEENLSNALDIKLKVNFILSDDGPQENEVDIEPKIKSTIDAFKGKIVNRFKK